MPNHFHGILQIVGAGFARPNISDARPDVCSNIHPDDLDGYSDNFGINTGWALGRASRRANPAPTPPSKTITSGNIIGYFKYQTAKKK
jgi:hypothetical protein